MPPDPSAMQVVDGFRPSSRVTARWGAAFADGDQVYGVIPPSDLTKATDVHRVPVGEPRIELA